MQFLHELSDVQQLFEVVTHIIDLSHNLCDTNYVIAAIVS